MDNINSITIIISLLGSIFIIGIIISFILYKYAKKKIQFLDKQVNDDLIKLNVGKKSIEYSTNLLEFIRTIINQIAVLEVKTFCDNHDLTKISKKNILNLVTKISKLVYEFLNINMENNPILFNESFYTYYITEITSATVKQMIEDIISKILNDE